MNRHINLLATVFGFVGALLGINQKAPADAAIECSDIGCTGGAMCSSAYDVSGCTIYCNGGGTAVCNPS